MTASECPKSAYLTTTRLGVARGVGLAVHILLVASLGINCANVCALCAVLRLFLNAAAAAPGGRICFHLRCCLCEFVSCAFRRMGCADGAPTTDVSAILWPSVTLYEQLAISGLCVFLCAFVN